MKKTAGRLDKKHMKLHVPYYSQFHDVTKKEWQSKACTVVCLKMALDYLVPGRAPSIDNLLHEAVIHSNSMLGRGLISEESLRHGSPHDVIVMMAHNYGVTAYREEFKSMSANLDGSIGPSQFAGEMLQHGLKKIVAILETGGLPIVSVLPGLSEGKSFHTILLVGFEDNNATLTGFYYHDSDAPGEARNDLFISLEEFIKYWRKMAICIG